MAYDLHRTTAGWTRYFRKPASGEVLVQRDEEETPNAGTVVQFVIPMPVNWSCSASSL